MKANFLCNGRQVCAHALLTAFVFIERNIQAKTTILFQPRETARHPFFAEFQIIHVRHIVFVRVILNIHIVRRGRNHEVHAIIVHTRSRQNIIMNEREFFVLKMDAK